MNNNKKKKFNELGALIIELGMLLSLAGVITIGGINLSVDNLNNTDSIVVVEQDEIHSIPETNPCIFPEMC